MQKIPYPFEVIIHDDASTDGTTEIVREYEKKYPDIIKPIYQKENQYSKIGQAIFPQCVWPKTQGKYIALLECDDFWTDPQKLETQVDYMEMHAGCSGTCHASDWMTDEKIIKNDQRFRIECDISPEQMILGGGDFVSTASLCFHKQCVLNWPYFCQVANVLDYPLQILLTLRGNLHYFPQTMSCYRFGRPGSWTDQMQADKEKHYKALRAAIRWLTELDKETNGKYATEIYYKIGKEKCVLYKRNQISFQELAAVLSHMKMGKLKLSMIKKCYERYMRYGWFR